MATTEMTIEHLTEQNSKLKAEKSQLQGEIHQLSLQIHELHNRDIERNVEINRLQERCSTCGVGGGR